jgi:hypothetical protein
MRRVNHIKVIIIVNMFWYFGYGILWNAAMNTEEEAKNQTTRCHSPDHSLNAHCNKNTHVPSGVTGSEMENSKTLCLFSQYWHCLSLIVYLFIFPKYVPLMDI